MAAARNSSYKLQGLVTLLYRYRFSSSAASTGPSHPRQVYNREFLSSKLGYGNFMNQGLRSFSGSTREADGKTHFETVKDRDKKVQPTLPVSDVKSFSTWVKWLFGSVLTVLLPFWKQNWESLRGLEGNVEEVVEEVEVVAELVENVATVAEKVSAEVAEKLPDNNKIREAVLVVEHLSTVIAQEAKLTEAFIHKVGDLKQDLKEIERKAGPVIDNIVEPRQQKVA